MNQKMAALLCVAAGLLLSGCASTRQIVPIASGPIAAGNARIAVLRTKQFHGCAAPLSVIDGNTDIGTLGPGGQLVWDRPAGPMVLTASCNDHTFSVGRGLPLRIGVADGMNYLFSLCIPFGGSFVPTLRLVSGTPVPFVENGTNATPAAAELAQAPPAADGEVRSFTGTIEAVGPVKSSPPKWPYARFTLVADDGARMDIFVLGATVFIDVEGKSSTGRRPKKGKKAEVRYSTAANGRNEAIDIRYLD